MGNEYTDKYRILYESDDRFRRYVDEYCKKHKINPGAAFDHATVRSVGDHYKKTEKR